MLGMLTIQLLSFWGCYILKNGTDTWGKPLLFFLIVCNIIFLLKKRDDLFDSLKSTTWGDCVSIIIAFFGASVILSLRFLYGAEYPYVDGFSYICNADYFQSYGYTVPVDSNDQILHPWLSQTFLYQKFHLRIGTQMMLALFSSFFSMHFSIDMFLPMIATGVVILSLGGSIFFTDNNSKIQILTTTIIALNTPIIIWMAQSGFLPQIYGSAFIVYATGQYFQIVNNFIDTKKKYDVREYFIIAISWCGIALSYSEMVPFMALLVISSLVYQRILLNKFYFQMLRLPIVSILICTFILFPYIPGMIKAIFSQFGAIVGWNQIKDLNTYISQFYSVTGPDYSYSNGVWDANAHLFQLITLLMIIATVLGFMHLSKQIKTEITFLMIPYVILYLYFLLFTDNPWAVGNIGNSWSVFKLMQYWYVLISPVIGLSLGTFLKRNSGFYFFVILYILYNSNEGIQYAKSLANNMVSYVGDDNEDPIQEYYDLYDKYANYENIIWLDNLPNKHRQLIAYFLQDNLLISNWDSDDYMATIPEFDINDYNVGIHLIYKPLNENEIAGCIEPCLYNWGEQLNFTSNNPTANDYCIAGFSFNEDFGTWNDGKEATMEFKLIEDPKDDIILYMELYPITDNQVMEIAIDDTIISTLYVTKEGWYSVTIPKKYVEDYNLDICFRFPNSVFPSDISSSMDNRELAIAFRHMYIN